MFRVVQPSSPPAPAPPAGLRERQKAARRDALVAAAQELVGAHGLDGVTVEEICDRAGVSTRTFFNYFASKDDAVLAMGPWAMDPAAADAFVAGGPTGDVMTDVEHLVVALVATPPAGSGRMACALELARRDHRLLARHVAVFSQRHADVADLVARRLGTPTSDPRAELLTGLVLSLTRTAFVVWDTGGQAGSVSAHVPGVVAQLRELLSPGSTT